VENVCSTCHVFQAQLFDKSPHKQALTAGCIVCHSNHRITHPKDEMVGTDSKAVCAQCHSDGDAGFRAAGQIRSSLGTLDTAIARSDEILGRAERSGMEVGEAKIQQAQAQDALTKARVAVHTASPEAVSHELDAGTKIAAQTYDAGVKALQERNFRRKGLGISLILIVFVVGALWMYIKDIESNGKH
jgi:predicted CXXCH cytochrome family protein